MPVYSYSCLSCGHTTERYKKLVDYKERVECVVCSHDMTKVLQPTKLNLDYEGYSCPITGIWIEGKKAHRENLARHEKRVLEPGEREDLERAKAREEEEFEKRLDETIDREVAGYSTQKMENLSRDVLGGADLTINRE